MSLSVFVTIGFLLTTMPFTFRAIEKDVAVGWLSPLILAARACAQSIGVVAGLIYTLRKPAPIARKSAA
jgi:hypothetical protein